MNPNSHIQQPEHLWNSFLMDTCCSVPMRDLPKNIIQPLGKIEELRDAGDYTIKKYLDKTNQILITTDHRFALNMSFIGKKSIFVDSHFDKNTFHIIYPSIQIKRGFFWKPEYVEQLVQPDEDMSYLFMKNTFRDNRS